MQQRPATGTLFKHIDGGYYEFVAMARHSEDQASLVLYQHVWPFDPAGDPWARPVAEWDARFTAVTQADLTAAMETDRPTAQAAVIRAKADRRQAASVGLR